MHEDLLVQEGAVVEAPPVHLITELADDAISFFDAIVAADVKVIVIYVQFLYSHYLPSSPLHSTPFTAKPHFNSFNL
ncbi:hypothetical protein Bpfe_000715 [Biomphalaria pfeifferi]|uniref:Uncharacterized protein n=1 Tax=Biomphalaria pfeifferi TaxID=112525 RepID=A0AAD8CBC6_BIOPF|nr:hypothetical protein Bpfe_000715 [Biomphalaria pfeifferi]